jgi:GNAT superfamily N-acetyltransferase
LAPAREGGAAASGPHPGAKAVLAFTGSLGWLVSAFHKVGPVTRALTVGASPSLSIRSQISARFTKLPTRRIFGITTRSEMAEKENVVIEPATEADLDELSEMLGELFAQEGDFRPDRDKQLRGLRLIFEQPSRGRVFVLRRNGAIVGMINLLFTISTAEGGFVILLEDLVVHTQFQGQGYGNKLLEHAIDFAKKKNFLRITLLTDRPENVAQAFFRKHGFIDSSMIPMRLWIAPQQDTD